MHICVYCGARSGRNGQFAQAATELAAEIARREATLVYGGGEVGIMGGLANEVLRRGGKVIGVIPAALARKEMPPPNLTRLHVVDSMHERKALMAELSDAFIALPGGYGTLDELFESLTWAQLGFHSKPCAILDQTGYYRKLIEFLDEVAKNEFVTPEDRSLLLVEKDPAVLLDKIECYQAPAVEKWIGRENL